MNPTRASRSLALALALLVSAGATSLATACQPRTSVAWKAGKTHGAIIEATAGRASLGIYRVPRKALYGAYRARGIRFVQDVIWAVGQPPAISRTFTYRGRTITTSFGTAALRSWTQRKIYEDPADLRGALVDAQARGNCLALTLISYGAPTSNWTHKSVGCQMGALP